MNVIHVNDQALRAEIESITKDNPSHKIVFIQDGSGKWVTSQECLDDDNFKNVKHLLEKGEIINYTPNQLTL